MADWAAQRRAVIEWFKTDFSEEARTTTRTSRLADGSLAYNFSVTNTSGLDFDKFIFTVKIIDRDSGMEIGTAAINAGQWLRGDRKNFKSRLAIPPHVRNISFVMYAETIDFDARQMDVVGDAMRDMADVARDMGQVLGKAGEDMGSMFGELFGTGGMPGGQGGAATATAPPPPQGQAQMQSAPMGQSATATQSAPTTQSRPATQTMPRPGSAVQSVGRAAQSYSQKKLEKRLNKKRLGKSGWVIAGIIIGVIFLMAAGGSILGSAEQISYIIIGAASLIATLVGKLSLNKKAKRIRTYETTINKNGNTSIDDLCAAVGRPFEKVADELHQMIVDGFFPNCYVDIENRLLVMTKDGKPVEDVARSAAINRKAGKNRGAAPESLDDLIAMTDDSEIKAKLSSLRTITKKIDARVEQVPELEKQVTDFREKYYPEVVRLTDEYNEKIVGMGKYGEEHVKPEVSESADGSPVLNTNPNYLQEQAAEIKAQLISLIDSVTEASENLLEKLHEGDIMDITTDIKMLQTTLASKGLLDSDFDVK